MLCSLVSFSLFLKYLRAKFLLDNNFFLNVPAIGLVIILFLSSFSAAEKNIESYEVKIIDEFKINKLLPGKITPKRQSILGFEISGKLKKVVVDIGDEVNAGDLLAELEDSEALANYNEAKAKLSMFEKIFERSLSLNKDNFISDQELERAESNFLVAEAQFDKALEYAKNINCKTSATKNNLRDAPNILDKRKYAEPDL